MPTMRAKMRVVQVDRNEACENLRFVAVSKSTVYLADGSDEDNTYAKFSPSGELKLTVANPSLFGKFSPGDVFYLDFTPVPKA